MIKALILMGLATAVLGIQYDGLRVKFGWSDALADMEYFYKIPRTMKDVEAEGWRRTERPPGPLPELRMYCPPGRGVCPMYDPAGFVAGLMIAFPVDEFESPNIKPEKKFVKWNAPAKDGEPAREYWTATQYYVSAESLKAGAGPQVANGATLQDGGVWVAGHDNRLMRIPSTEAELNSTIFKRQNCIPNMGTHYYYNMTKSLDCDQLLPWFALTMDNELVGTGFQMVGKLTRPQPREWFENYNTPARMSLQTVTPHAPQCLIDWVEKYGLLSLHIYYINNPWTIKCKKGDSIQPVPALERLLLNGYRYVNKVSDEMSRLFKG